MGHTPLSCLPLRPREEHRGFDALLHSYLVYYGVGKPKEAHLTRSMEDVEDRGRVVTVVAWMQAPVSIPARRLSYSPMFQAHHCSAITHLEISKASLVCP